MTIASTVETHATATTHVVLSEKPTEARMAVLSAPAENRRKQIPGKMCTSWCNTLEDGFQSARKKNRMGFDNTRRSICVACQALLAIHLTRSWLGEWQWGESQLDVSGGTISLLELLRNRPVSHI